MDVQRCFLVKYSSHRLCKQGQSSGLIVFCRTGSRSKTKHPVRTSPSNLKSASWRAAVLGRGGPPIAVPLTQAQEPGLRAASRRGPNHRCTTVAEPKFAPGGVWIGMPTRSAAEYSFIVCFSNRHPSQLHYLGNMMISKHYSTVVDGICFGN